ncbi:helix-turn-helix domain-containing protein [Sphingomonas sp. HT-1]|uniref:helix-turn-helix domain-containing protein n=1 Tax=unclassified Sphingomonas TaxID=196159 RepID=UPI00056561AE|nr:MULTISPECIES: helix-turn-helix domain-containing protein [unclassified Sphingomonas]KTF67759.1 hypothetical protein ATB93_16800 [Sphingomonas sp. WG]
MQDTPPSAASWNGAPPQLPRAGLMARLIAELQVSMITAGARALDGDLDRAIVFMVVARISDMPSPGHALAERRASQAISINALAASLARPFETMRRHIHALCDRGLCTRGPAGVTVPEAVQARPEIAALFRSSHDALVRLAEDLAAFGFALPETRAHRPYDWRSGLAAAHDILLTGVEFSAHRYQSWTDMVMANAILCANCRPIMEDRATSIAYAEFSPVPPEALRRPVSTGAIARALGLPPSTAHRRVAAMVESGFLVRRKRGVMLADSAITDAQRLADARTALLHTRQILIRLAAGGFRFANPAACYLDGRPELVPFG